MSGSTPIPPSDSVEDFLKQFIGGLASPKLSSKGDLTTYLSGPQSERSGDEANIVDLRVSQALILALGYTTKDFKYNELKDHLRPDFEIKITEYPNRACFVIEDKNTTEMDLVAHRSQLQSYMGHTKAPRGLLCNGQNILAYDQVEGSLQTPVIELSLVEAVHIWKGESLVTGGKIEIEAFHVAGALPAWAAFWRRFRRESFASLARLIDDLTLQSTVGHNEPHRTDGSTWVPSNCRIPIVSVDETNASSLTESLKSLIAEIEDDADAQFAALEYNYAEFLALASRVPGGRVTFQVEGDGLSSEADRLLVAVKDPDQRQAIMEIVQGVLQGSMDRGQLPLGKKRMYEALPMSKPGNGGDPIHSIFTRIAAHVSARSRHLETITPRYAETIRIMSEFNEWKQNTAALVFRSDASGEMRREFLTQTSYLIVIRILLVRIMEDKGLVKRMFTNGGVALWFLQVEPHYLSMATGRSPVFLLDMAYTNAQHIYAHFYSEKTIFDWYQPDRNSVIRVLHVLAGYDLKKINRDIIGSVYNQYVESKHKKESGLYYTPHEVVSYMLDRVGYNGPGIIGKRILDLSCGSGGFLVEAAFRLANAYKEYWKAKGHPTVPPERIQEVLDSIRKSLHGIDLNPFACSLAETNLLIQVIDFFAIAFSAKEPEHASIDRFHIYNSDSLTFSENTLSLIQGGLPYPPDDLPVADRIKAGLGEWKDKFDFVVGNPPYVRADEGSDGQTEFREKVKNDYPVEFVRDVLVKKWDLFVPFVAASHALLKAKSEYSGPGRAAILTSNAIETVPYTEALRKHLVAKTSLEEIHFFEGVKLFEDAEVFNTVTVFKNELPSSQHHVTRFWHEEAPSLGSHKRAKNQSLKQRTYGVDVFRQNLPSTELKAGVKMVPLTEVCYISKGMALHADEDTNKGAFVLEDLLSPKPDTLHCAAFSGSKDIGPFGILNIRYLEYGPTTRVPSKVSRPTFPEFYDRPKLMVAEFGGFALDDGTWDPAGFLKCNHSIFILMPWHQLKGVQNKSLQKELKNNATPRADLEALSIKFDPWYLLAYLNSRQMREMLDGVTRSAIKKRSQPDDLREISIPLPNDPALVANISALAKEAHDIQKQLLPLRMNGWRIGAGLAIGPAWIVAAVPTLPLASACVTWGIQIKNGGVKANGLSLKGSGLFSGKREALVQLSGSPGIPPRAMEWIRRQFASFPEGTTIEEVERQGVLVPANPGAAITCLDKLEQQEKNVMNHLVRIEAIQDAISIALGALFSEIIHPPIKG